MLYERVLSVSDEEKFQTAQFLKSEYEMELLEYPAGCPPFDSAAAVWAAQVTYISAQLILYRETEEQDLDSLLPSFESPITVSAVLSADLCLRFIPDMVRQLQIIDSGDKLIEVLESILQRWPYSGINYKSPDFKESEIDFIQNNSYLYKMYCERIVKDKITKLAEHPAFSKGVSAQLGIYGQELWKEFKTLQPSL